MTDRSVLPSLLGAILFAVLAASTADAQVGPVREHWLEHQLEEVLPHGRYGDLTEPISLVLGEDKTFRGALRMGLIGAGIGAIAGFGMEVVDPDGEIADIWPTLLAIPGFFGGLIYYAVR